MIKTILPEDRIKDCLDSISSTTRELSFSMVKVIVATEETIQSTKMLSEELNAIRDRYTWFGWILYKLGLV